MNVQGSFNTRRMRPSSRGRGVARFSSLFARTLRVASCMGIGDVQLAFPFLLMLVLYALAGAQSHESPVTEYEILKAGQRAFSEAAARIRPSVVRIDTVGGAQPAQTLEVDLEVDLNPQPLPRPPKRQNDFQDEPGSSFVIADGPTTGIIYSPDGYIISSGFNFVRDPALVSVTLSDGRRLAADVIARDQVRKLALLKIDAANLPVPTWTEPDEVRIGHWVIALGFGFGAEQPAMTVGIVSAKNRMHGNAVQTDAKLSPANYGGPLCDLDGRVIGIAVPLAERPGELAGVELYDSGVGFALPRYRVDEIVSTLKSGNNIYRGWLGLEVHPKIRDAVVVGRLADPSPLHAAGIKPGDVILGAAGREVKHFGHFVEALNMIPAGEEVYLHLRRGKMEFGISVRLVRNTELGPLPDSEEPFDPANPWSEFEKKDEGG